MVANRLNFLGLIVAILFVLTVSLSTLTTKPGLWVDEAKSIILARNFANSGTLDILAAPGTSSGQKPLLQSTGYPVTVPLALVYKIFGQSFVIARWYMLIWMCIALIAIYLFCKKFFGPTYASFAVLLIVTFASFHDSGRTVVGEVPGFVFLLGALYFWLFNKNNFVTGLFLGLAVVTKPSVYLAIIPAITIIEPATSGLIRSTLRRLTIFAAGSLSALTVWAVFSIDWMTSGGVASKIFEFFSNPFDSSSLTVNALHNLASIPSSTTFWYFGGLALLLILARWKTNDQVKSKLFDFVLLYSLFAFIYFLRSPGWIRTILVSELMILICTPIVLHTLTRSKAWIGGLVMLVAIQTWHFFNAAQIQYSDAAIIIANKINVYETDKKIGIVNALEVSALLDSQHIIQTVHLLGIPTIGKHPLENSPDLIVTGPASEQFGYLDAIEAKYKLVDKEEGFRLYLRRQEPI
ncbi:MAG TPA: glycosyltransferase family 39 protein [Candidatus Paceibacterota bacterium]